jgi:hypothetical protein
MMASHLQISESSSRALREIYGSAAMEGSLVFMTGTSVILLKRMGCLATTFDRSMKMAIELFGSGHTTTDLDVCRGAISLDIENAMGSSATAFSRFWRPATETFG